MILRKQKARDFQLRNSSFLILPLSLIIFQQVVDREYESHVNSHLTLTSQMTSLITTQTFICPKTDFISILRLAKICLPLEDKSA